MTRADLFAFARKTARGPAEYATVPLAALDIMPAGTRWSWVATRLGSDSAASLADAIYAARIIASGLAVGQVFVRGDYADAAGPVAVCAAVTAD